MYLLLVAFGLSAQVPTFEELPRGIRKEARQDLREAKRDYKKLQREGWEILPDPIETPIEIPVSYFDPGSLEIVSWQTKLQRMPELYDRIQQECKYPVHFKVSDSGADQTHKDLQAGFVKENDWTGEGDNPGIHGTHVAGDVVQFMYPLIEIGLCTWDDEKSLRAAGSGSFAWPANMFLQNRPEVEERVNKGETVIYNCSWGGGSNIIESLEIQMRKTVEVGGIIVAAFGNTGGAGGYPGNSIYTLGITSLDENLSISSFSSRGPEVWGTAGGRNIYSTLPNGKYGLASGTSMASPSFAAIFVGYARAKWGPERLPDYPALKAYYEKIAVQVGNGNPELYGPGYAYIEAILNTPPDGDGGGGDNPPPPPPPPPSPDTYYVAGVDTDGHIMRWRYENENGFRLLYVPVIEWEAVGEKSEDVAYQEASEFIDKYFVNRAIVLPADMGSYSATWWTGQFLEYVGNNEGYAIDVTLLTGQDVQGSYQARNFDKASAEFMQMMQGVELVDIPVTPNR